MSAEAIKTVLIANRGEIALRVINSCRQLGIRSVAVYSSADREMPFVHAADEAIAIGPPEAAASYLNVDQIIDACRTSGADAVHPGYGFLSENAGFARCLAEANIRFIGPAPETIESMGDKISARRLMEAKGVPIVPGYHGDDQSNTNLTNEARRIGYPVMIKASAGGGGRGMRLVFQESDFSEALESARREARNAFGDDRVFVEKFVESPRHVEIQVFGDAHGNIVHLFERECSIQRRHQKIIEESPSPAISPETRAAMAEAAVAAARAVDYLGAGTVEFIYSDTTQSFYFLEMNTRLQVEHPVTELVTGRDLVAEQIRVAEGAPLSFAQESLNQKGHAIEVRLYAEDPAQNFMPATGPVHRFVWPEGDGIRVDSGVESGSEVSLYYDPMVAKIIAHAPDRATAIARLDQALADTVFFGPENNLAFLRAILSHPQFQAGEFTTAFIEQHFSEWSAPAPDDLSRSLAGLLHYHAAVNYAEAIPAELRTAADVWRRSTGFRVWPGT